MNRINCPICGNSTTEYIDVKDYLFSREDKDVYYKYMVCEECGSIYRARESIIDDGIFGDDYFIRAGWKEKGNVNLPRVRSIIRKQLHCARAKYAFVGKSRVVGQLLYHIRKPEFAECEYFKTPFREGKTFLDVGCGRG